MNENHTESVANANRVVSPGAAALTAMIMAQGISGTAHANNAAKEWAEAEARGEKATELAQVDVTAELDKKPVSPKFTQPLRDTPQTIVTIPSEVYLQQGAATLSDVLRNTSGITFAAGEGGSATSTAGDSFYLRGFDTTNSIFVDGVRDVGAYSRDVFNIEQVQIAKGPAGADVGRGGPSGYVNLGTKVPHAENFVGSTVSYGFDEATSGSRRRTTVDINQSLGDTAAAKGVALRVNALWEDNDGVGRDYAENKTWGIAPSLAVGLGTQNRAYVTYQHTKQEATPDYGLPSALLPGYLSPTPVPPIDRSTFFGSTSDFDNVNADAGMLRLEHDFNSSYRLSNQTRYSANQRTAVATTPGSSSAAYVPATGLLTRSRQGNKRDSSILSNQTNLTGQLNTGFIAHSFAGGVELSRERSYSPALVTATLTPVPIQSVDPTAPIAPLLRSGAYTNVKTETGALYLFDTARFNEHWQANASLRAERYNTDYSNVAATGVPTAVSAKHNLVSWKTGLVYKPVPAGTIYAAYSVALTPPGSDFTLSSAAGNQNNPDTDPQETKNVEVGVKWDFFRNRLTTTAAVFKTVNDKTVFTDPILGAIPAGKQTVQGLELGATGKISDHWLVLASVSYLDSKINAGTTSGGNLAGSELPLIPKYSGNVFTSYRLPFHLVIGGGANYADAISRRDNNSPAVPRQMPSFWVFNALASYPVTKNLSLRLNVNNLFDREYTQSFNNNGARFMPAAPRAYLVSADLRF
jgi:catecholate siderophore receptor